MSDRQNCLSKVLFAMVTKHIVCPANKTVWVKCVFFLQWLLNILCALPIKPCKSNAFCNGYYVMLIVFVGNKYFPFREQIWGANMLCDCITGANLNGCGSKMFFLNHPTRSCFQQALCNCFANWSCFLGVKNIIRIYRLWQKYCKTHEVFRSDKFAPQPVCSRSGFSHHRFALA